jgi:hypothetical protein
VLLVDLGTLLGQQQGIIGVVISSLIVCSLLEGLQNGKD